MNRKILFLLIPFFLMSFLTTPAQTLNEGFEDSTFPPAGWQTENVLGAVMWMRATGITHSGSGSAIIAWEVTGGEDWLITPQLNILSGDSLKFWTRKFWPDNYQPDSLEIRISTSDNLISSFTTILAAYDVNTFPNPDFGEHEIDLSGFSDQSVYIAFKHFDVNGNGMYLDDVKIEGGVVPVELESFTASVSGKDVTLSWRTATELNNSGFNIERRVGEESWNNLGFVEGFGTTTETQNYTFVDEGLASGIYNYRIKQINYDGSFDYYELKNEIEIVALDKYLLSQNYPNPFNPSTQIDYQLPKSGLVQLKVYDLLGREVAILVDEVKSEGSHSINFNADELPSGVYIYSLRVNDFVQYNKMTLLK